VTKTIEVFPIVTRVTSKALRKVGGKERRKDGS